MGSIGIQVHLLNVVNHKQISCCNLLESVRFAKKGLQYWSLLCFLALVLSEPCPRMKNETKSSRNKLLPNCFVMIVLFKPNATLQMLRSKCYAPNATLQMLRSKCSKIILGKLVISILAAFTISLSVSWMPF